MKFAINGRFLTRNITGQERFALEIVKALDNICDFGEFVIITPQYAEDNRFPFLKNIKIIKYGKVKKHFWEQLCLRRYLKKNKLTCINLTTTCPIGRPDITCVHDIGQIVNKQWYKSMYGRLSSIWHNMMVYFVFKKSKLILTVSNFSKNQIIQYKKINEDRILVLGNGWEHFKELIVDENVLKKYSLTKGDYVFCASSITPQKNFKWIIENAKINPNIIYAIAGKKEKISLQADFKDIPKNMIFLGYVSDVELKSLMTYCRVFIHPALYEGFGIPPLEALSTGCKVIVANSSCLPEIYGDSVIYIEPNKYDYSIDELLKKEVKNPCSILKKYSWSNISQRLYDYLKNKYEK